MFQCVFIPLHKVKNIKNTMCVCYSQVDLKLTDLTLLDAHTLPTHGTALRVCVRTSFSVCVPHYHQRIRIDQRCSLNLSLHIFFQKTKIILSYLPCVPEFVAFMYKMASWHFGTILVAKVCFILFCFVGQQHVESH